MRAGVRERGDCTTKWNNLYILWSRRQARVVALHQRAPETVNAHTYTYTYAHTYTHVHAHVRARTYGGVAPLSLRSAATHINTASSPPDCRQLE